ncbi:TSUP family transporter [soil metagenome]
MHELFTNPNFYFLLIAAFTAGFVDAIVGGGGLIQLPAMFLAFPSLPTAVVFGSNKFASFSGTSVATIRFLGSRPVKWQAVLPAIITALIFSTIGAHLVSLFDKNILKPFILVLLILVAFYTFFKKDFGLIEKSGVDGKKKILVSLLVGSLIGLYDGFFGPGTGSFLILIYISVFGFDFLDSSISAKLINCATNLAALTYFIYTGNIRFDIAVPVALCNVAGSLLGVKMALLKGSGFIRVFYLVVVSGLILKFAWDIFSK